MKNLCELQQQFQNYLLGQSQLIELDIVNTKTVSAKTRLNIYGDAYTSRLLEVLEEEFPGLHTLLGDQCFYEMVLQG